MKMFRVMDFVVFGVMTICCPLAITAVVVTGNLYVSIGGWIGYWLMLLVVAASEWSYRVRGRLLDAIKEHNKALEGLNDALKNKAEAIGFKNDALMGKVRALKDLNGALATEIEVVRNLNEVLKVSAGLAEP